MDRMKDAAFVCILGVVSLALGYGWLTFILGVIALALALGLF